ncbi:MAG: NFACT family protein [Erysipelotrichales bacterium]|nr:NFACT family protein [Erysipelotrichales bacterium]
MAIDGFFLNKLIRELKFIENKRIRKINMLSRDEFSFNIYGFKTSSELLISTNPDFPYITIIADKPQVDNSATYFLTILRKNLEGALITSINQYQNDRIIIISTSRVNELGDLKVVKLILELTGRHANLILIENERIIDSLKRMAPTDNARTLLPGAQYQFFPQNNKKNPFLLAEAEIKTMFKNNTSPIYDFLKTNFSGISDLLCQAVTKNSEYYNNFMTLLTVFQPIIIDTGKKLDIYFTAIDEVKIIRETSSLIELINLFVREKYNHLNHKGKSQILLTPINQRLKKIETKKIALESDILKNENADLMRKNGELILHSGLDLDSKFNTIKVFDYSDNQDLEISLDDRLTLKENATAFFKTYRKKKASFAHIKRELKKATEEIEYLNILQNQIGFAENNDLEIIRNELIENNYLPKEKIVKKTPKNNFTTYVLKNNIEIMVGKNNRQNELLTMKTASKNAMWFHVQNAPSAHIVVQNEGELDEETIRSAALIACHYSKFKNSDSVPVIYTRIKFLKKISGLTFFKVSYKAEKTIFINSDPEFIASLKKRNF